LIEPVGTPDEPIDGLDDTSENEVLYIDLTESKEETKPKIKVTLNIDKSNGSDAIRKSNNNDVKEAVVEITPHEEHSEKLKVKHEEMHHSEVSSDRTDTSIEKFHNEVSDKHADKTDVHKGLNNTNSKPENSLSEPLTTMEVHFSFKKKPEVEHTEAKAETEGSKKTVVNEIDIRGYVKPETTEHNTTVKIHNITESSTIEDHQINRK